MRTSHVLSSTLLFALATACGEAPSDLQLGAVAQPIVNGEDSDASQDSVVYVLNRGFSYCSGTMIAPNLVATALHCITGRDLGFFECESDGTLVNEEGDGGKMGSLVEASKISIVSGANIVGVEPVAYGKQLLGTGAVPVCGGDIGFIVLDRDLDLPLATVRLDYGVKAGDLINGVGYGQTEEDGSTGRHTRSGIRVVEVGKRTADEPTISAAPRTFQVGEGPCHGDSGGPAFAEDTGALVGVYSLNASPQCVGASVRNVYTSLDMYSTLALDAFEAAGAEPILDAPPPAEPEAPSVVPESGCSIGGNPASNRQLGSLVSLAMLGLGVVVRRRRV